MSTRNDILNTLKTELETITSVVEVIRGIQIFENIVSKPAICFWCWQDELADHTHGTAQFRYLNIYLYGYCDTDGLGNVDDIHELCDDVETFLYNSFTYKSKTYIGDIVIYEGGVTDPASIFEMELKIQYRKS